jgi:hypothetical protein
MKLVVAVAVVAVGLVAAPVAAQTQNPIQAIKDAWKKAREQQKEQQQQKQQTQQPQQQQRQQQPGQRQRPGQQPAPGQAQAADAGPITPPPGTKIEEKVLAPVQQGAQFFVSPRGVNVATVALSGSRQVVWYNGVEGPKFDEILGAGTGSAAAAQKVAFSPDGNRYAYCARAGNEVVVMVDGKELTRTSEPPAPGGFGSLCEKLGFASNSKHVYYLSHVMPPSGPGKYPYTRFVFDGVPSPPSQIPGGDPAISPDGDHFAYVWQTPDPSRPQPQKLIIDGKPAPYLGGDPQWSADGKHLYTQIPVSLGPARQAVDLLLDGKPIMRAESIRLFIPPAGDMTVAVVRVGQSVNRPLQFLVVGGRKVPGSELTAGGGFYNDVIFSPDGKHYASKMTGVPGKEYVFVDGKKALDYFKVDKVSFTADSSKVVYQAWVQGNKTFVVVGDQESEAFEGLVEPVTAPSGNRVGGILSASRQAQLFVDGKTTRVNANQVTDLGFSPDATRYAYIAGGAGVMWHLVLDGVVQPNSSFGNPFVSEPRYVWSPDSKHIAHFHEGGGVKGAFLDGKVFPMAAAPGQGMYTMLSFTPDSKHLIWARNQTVQGDQGFRVFVDGKPVYEGLYAIQGWFSSVPGSWEMAPDGTLSFVTQDDNSLKRVSITPSPETSLDTLLALAR